MNRLHHLIEPEHRRQYNTLKSCVFLELQPLTARPPEHVTLLLTRVARGERSAAEELLPLVYDNLRALAGSYFRHESPNHTLVPTAVVHEAYVKLVGGEQSGWQNRAHFFAVAASAMRQILADHARRKKAAKRGGGQHRVTLSGLVTPPTAESQIDLVALDEALARLADLYPEQARITELRFLAGLQVNEVAEILGVSESTIERKWRMARAWLRRELSGTTMS